jgi:fructokinase
MRIGIDFGGTKIEGLLIDAAGTERARVRVDTPRHDYDASVRAVRDLVVRLKAEGGAARASVGVGIPGSISPASGFVRNANSVWLIGRPFDKDLGEALGQPVRVANDANCFALSEAVDGAGADARVVFGIIVGTGVGGGVIIDKRVLEGRNGVGGEWGHIPLPNPRDEERPGPKCYCGRHGCLEVWLSGPGLTADFAKSVGAAPHDAPTAREVAEMAEAGDPDAEAALDRLIDRFGRSLAVVVDIVDPDVVVLGGGLSNLDILYERLPEAMRPHVFSDVVETEIRRNVHGDSSGVRGAAWLWEDAQ